MEKKKFGNSGFSLIELIITVLVMAIIMVALAPQVMKWVNNARISTDVQTKDSIVSYTQYALADPAAYQCASSKVIKISVTTTDCKITMVGGGSVSEIAPFVNSFVANAGTSISGSDSEGYSIAGLTLKTEGAEVQVFSNFGKVSTTTIGLESEDLDLVADYSAFDPIWSAAADTVETSGTPSYTAPPSSNPVSHIGSNTITNNGGNNYVNGVLCVSGTGELAKIGVASDVTGPVYAYVASDADLSARNYDNFILYEGTVSDGKITWKKKLVNGLK